MDDEFAAPRLRPRFSRVLFGLAAVSTFMLTAFPLSSYNLGAFAGTLALAALIRAVYVKLNRRRRQLPFLSGWIFVLALGVAVLSASGRHRERVEAASRAAERHGVVSSADEATAAQRCVGVALDEWEATPQLQSALPERQFRRFAIRVCDQAERDAVLHDDGSIPDRALQPIATAVAAEMRAEAGTLGK